jgi:hypothetical protein
MYGLTRGAITLVGVIVAGFLIWLGVDPLSGESVGRGEFWWAVLMCALAGFVIALSQVLGGWTKWGWPRLSLNVFLFAFLPTLIAGGWVLLYAQPGNGPLADDVRDWSNDLGIEGVTGDLAIAWLAISFGLGLVFGLTIDTTGPAVRQREDDPRAAEPEPRAVEPVAEDVEEDDRRVRIHQGTPTTPDPEPPPRSDVPDR